MRLLRAGLPEQGPHPHPAPADRAAPRDGAAHGPPAMATLLRRAGSTSTTTTASRPARSTACADRLPGAASTPATWSAGCAPSAPDGRPAAAGTLAARHWGAVTRGGRRRADRRRQACPRALPAPPPDAGRALLGADDACPPGTRGPARAAARRAPEPRPGAARRSPCTSPPASAPCSARPTAVGRARGVPRAVRARRRAGAGPRRAWPSCAAARRGSPRGSPTATRAMTGSGPAGPAARPPTAAGCPWSCDAASCTEGLQTCLDRRALTVLDAVAFVDAAVLAAAAASPGRCRRWCCTPPARPPSWASTPRCSGSPRRPPSRSCMPDDWGCCAFAVADVSRGSGRGARGCPWPRASPSSGRAGTPARCARPATRCRGSRRRRCRAASRRAARGGCAGRRPASRRARRSPCRDWRLCQCVRNSTAIAAEGVEARARAAAASLSGCAGALHGRRRSRCRRSPAAAPRLDVHVVGRPDHRAGVGAPDGERHEGAGVAPRPAGARRRGHRLGRGTEVYRAPSSRPSAAGRGELVGVRDLASGSSRTSLPGQRHRLRPGHVSGPAARAAPACGPRR